MKLQRNNKYLNKITAGLSSLLLASTLIAGCANENEGTLNSTKIVETVDEQIPVVDEQVPAEKVRDITYFLNYYRLRKEAVEIEEKKYDVKYPNELLRMNQVNTLIVKNNEEENYKIILVKQIIDKENNIIHYYELFTDEHIFDMSYNGNAETDKYGKISNYDFNNMQNAIPFFDNNKVVEYGLCNYSGLFVTTHLKELSKRDGIDYMDPKWEPCYILFPRKEFNTSEEFHTTKEMLWFYVQVVLPENTITGYQMGLPISYREEDKYKDYWKLSDKEIQSNIADFEIKSPNTVLNARNAQTLVIKDSKDNYKVLNTIMYENGNMQEFYDLYSGLYLFSLVNSGDITYDANKGYSGFNFNSMTDAIPYFDDKTIAKLDSLPKTNYFISEHIQELSEKDGIKYNSPEEGLSYILYPTGEYFTADINHTLEEYARVLAQSVPKEMLVPYNELIVGLELENAKVLVK